MLMQDVSAEDRESVDARQAGDTLEWVLTGLFVVGLLATMLDFNTLL